jgi:transglutaminase-like putative cysteine protease
VRLRASLACLLLAPTPGPVAAAEWSVGPRPSWVVREPAPAPLAAPAPDATPGSYELLFDHQLRVGDDFSDEYVRRVVQVLTSAGVQDAAQLSVDFDPSSERLVFHRVGILRHGTDVSSFAPSDVSVIRPERESDDAIYSGSLSALVFLRDVRPGDVLDYDYSLQATASSPPPSFATTLDMAYSVPVARLRQRLLWPAGRRLHVRTHGSVPQPQVVAQGPTTVYSWTRQDVPAVVSEGDLPEWFDPYPAVELSEFGSWTAVADWAAEVYAGVAADPRALDATLRQWSALPGLEDRALAAVRFVQDDIRYLGLEIGPGAWEPRPPAEVLARRYGDCKDKSLLLAALLRRLGLDACPALVSAATGRGIETRLPSPLAFDHVIVRLRLAGRDVWIDPTLTQQGGRLRSLAPPPFERALPIVPGQADLETIPRPPPNEPTISVREDYDAPRGAPASLSVMACYRDADADSMRANLGGSSPNELASTYLNHYATAWPAIQVEAPPAVSDWRDDNRLEVRARYRIPGFWQLPHRVLEAWSLADVLQKPRTLRRSMPLALDHPARLSHRFSIRLPAPPDELPRQARVDDPAFCLARSVRLDGDRIEVGLDYRSLADAVAPGALPAHLANLDRAQAQLQLQLALPTGRTARRRWLALAAFASFALLFEAWRRRRPRPR